jgi:hypothetical protein
METEAAIEIHFTAFKLSLETSHTIPMAICDLGK